MTNARHSLWYMTRRKNLGDSQANLLINQGV